MTTAVAARLRFRDALTRRPERGAVAAAATAWAAMIALHGSAGPPSHGGHGGAGPPDPPAALPMWALMCLAMMVPVTLPAIRHVATNSLRWRRGRAVTGFLVAYLAVWIAFGAVVLPVLRLAAGSVPAGVPLAGALGLGAAWQLLPFRLRFVRDCHRTVPLPPHGWPAVAASLRFGSRHGRACLGVCWPLMLVMATAMSAPVLWMVALTTVVLAVRSPSRNAWTGGPLALALGGLAVIILITA